jgi:hypothetical protein
MGRNSQVRELVCNLHKKIGVKTRPNYAEAMKMEVMGKIPQALRVNRVCGGFLDMEKIREV